MTRTGQKQWHYLVMRPLQLLHCPVAIAAEGVGCVTAVPLPPHPLRCCFPQRLICMLARVVVAAGPLKSPPKSLQAARGGVKMGMGLQPPPLLPFQMLARCEPSLESPSLPMP